MIRSWGAMFGIPWFSQRASRFFDETGILIIKELLHDRDPFSDSLPDSLWLSFPPPPSSAMLFLH